MKTSFFQLAQFRKASMVILVMGVALLPFNANAAVFAKFEGVDGESRDANHDKWIDVLSVSEGIHQPDSGATGTTRRRGAVVFDNIVIGKFLDRSSPKLREDLAQGKVFPKVEIEITQSCDGRRETYFKYELKNVLITGFSLNAVGSEDRPVESVALNFEEIIWTYTIFDNRCIKAGDVEASWKLEQGTQ